MHSKKGINPKNGTAVFLLNCSLSTLPLLTHRLNFETQFDYDGIALLLRTSAPLRVLHGPFASAEIAVEPVRASATPLHARLACSGGGACVYAPS